MLGASPQPALRAARARSKGGQPCGARLSLAGSLFVAPARPRPRPSKHTAPAGLCLPACPPRRYSPADRPWPRAAARPAQARPASCAARYLGISRTGCLRSTALRLYARTDRSAVVVWRLRLVSAGTPRVVRAGIVPTNTLQVDISRALGPSESFSAAACSARTLPRGAVGPVRARLRPARMPPRAAAGRAGGLQAGGLRGGAAPRATCYPARGKLCAPPPPSCPCPSTSLLRLSPYPSTSLLPLPCPCPQTSPTTASRPSPRAAPC